MQTSLTNEAITRAASTSVITTGLSNEISWATSAEAVVTAAVSAEAATRLSAVSGVQSDVTLNKSSFDTYVTNNDASIASEVAARGVAVENEKIRAEAVESTLTTSLATEITTRSSADAALQVLCDDLQTALTLLTSRFDTLVATA